MKVFLKNTIPEHIEGHQHKNTTHPPTSFSITNEKITHQTGHHSTCPLNSTKPFKNKNKSTTR
jgi:hypothetical protein